MRSWVTLVVRLAVIGWQVSCGDHSCVEDTCCGMASKAVGSEECTEQECEAGADIATCSGEVGAADLQTTLCGHTMAEVTRSAKCSGISGAAEEQLVTTGMASAVHSLNAAAGGDTEGAAESLYALHGKALEMLGHVGSSGNCLAELARKAKRGGLLPANLHKRLVQLDTAVSWLKKTGAEE